MADKNIYELIQKWCEHQNRSVYSLYKDEGAKLTESTIRSIRDGDNPEYATLKILADELHVPVPDAKKILFWKKDRLIPWKIF